MPDIYIYSCQPTLSSTSSLVVKDMLEILYPNYYNKILTRFYMSEIAVRLESFSLFIFILFIALPKAPGIPVVTERTATSITLTWDSGNPEPVSYYIIQVRKRHLAATASPR